MAERFVIDDIPVELHCHDQRRTRIGMNIDPGGFVVLDAPASTSYDEVEEIVRQHGRWLKYRVRKIQEETAHLGKLSLKTGELVAYLGSALELRQHAAPDTLIEGGVLYVPEGDDEAVKAAVRTWYRERAKEAFSEVFESYAFLPWLAEVKPRWRQRFLRRRWGSCSDRGEITLNTHLVRTPLRLIEYVVLHELCHLVHRDHSRRFHALLSQYMDDWQERSAELGKNVGLLLDDF